MRDDESDRKAVFCKRSFDAWGFDRISERNASLDGDSSIRAEVPHRLCNLP